MKRLAFAAALILSLIANPLKSFAWGKTGHELVGQIAFQLLDKETRNKVLKDLQGFDFAQAATWMDDERRNSQFDAMKPWHYIDIEKDSAYKPTAEKNALTLLNSIISKFQQHSTLSGQMQRDLLILFHLVGDLHQPLHTGYPSDRGGNDVSVNIGGSSTNLHSFWDTRLIEEEHVSLKECMEVYKTYSKEKVDQLEQISVMGWFKESRSFLPAVYGFNNFTIDKQYRGTAKPIIMQQLVAAGVRLASVLKMVYGSNNPPLQ